MSSVSGVTSSNSSSIYGNRNVLSGLATGMDTETMIKNAVSGYQTKIDTLQQRQTKLTWKQEAYRDLTDPMVQFSRKYTSYTSSTNLYSASFFNNAVTTTTNGENAAEVSATGKSSSDIEILGVKQLATATTYNVSAAMNLGGSASGICQITGEDEFDIDATLPLSNVSGTLTLTYGSSRTIDLSFDDLDTYDSADDFLEAINTKLANTTVIDSSGDSVAASTMVKAELQDGQIVFSDNQNSGNSVTITSATGKIKDTLNIDTSAGSSSLDVSTVTSFTDSTTTVGDYLSGKTLSVTVDGKTKKITLPEYTSGESAADFVSDLNSTLQDTFGSGVEATTDLGKLQITGQSGSTIYISATEAVGKALGLGGSISTSYLNTGSTLGDLLYATYDTDTDGNITGETMDGMTGVALTAMGTITRQSDGTYQDSEGNLVDSDGNRLGKDGKQLYGYDLTVNGVKVGTYTRDTALETVLTGVNSSSDAGVNVSFSKTTNTFQFTAQETGTAGTIEFGEGLAQKLFSGGDTTAGQDAILSMQVNGTEYDDISRSDNNFSVDGLSITLKGTFGYTSGTLDADAADNAVSFTTTSDADTIVDAVTSMVDDLNDILQSVHDAYSTQPLTKSDNSSYEPLTDDDEEDMTDAQIEKYEEKAKTGILFGDSDLSSLYSKLLTAITPSGTDGNTLSSIGITTNYSDGVTTLEVDEDALRDALANDPDTVRDAFTKTTGVGGIMTNIKSAMDAYDATSGATKGILIQKAGSTFSPLSLLNNDLQDQIDDLDDQISDWEDKLSDKVDYYTERFTQLEQLTAQMNSQSSMLSSMLGS